MKLGNIGKAFVLGSFCIIASTTRAQALDFNFSMNGNLGSNPGQITGIIRGLSDNSTDSSFQVEVYQHPLSRYVGLYSGGVGGSFTVNGGKIESVNNVYQIVRNNQLSDYISFNFLTEGQKYYNGTFQNYFSDDYTTGNELGFGGVTYSSATAVPFDFNPAEGAALGVPLFIGLGLLRKKKLAQKSAAKKVAELVS